MTVTLDKVRDPVDPDRVADIDDVPDDDGYGGELVPFDDSAVDPWSPSPLRRPLERFANRPLPTLHSVRASASWWTWALGHAGLRLFLYWPLLLLFQVPHVCRGLGRWAKVYAEWRAKPEWMSAAKEADAPKKADKIAAVERHKRNATRLTWLAFVLIVVGVIVAVRNGYSHAVLAAFTALFIVADLVGRKDAITNNKIAVMPRSNFREGAPSHMVIADVKAVLVQRGHDEETTAVVEPRVGEYGLTMNVHSQRALAEEDIGAIERGLQAYRGAVQVVGDPDNAAVSELRVWWTDPLKDTIIPCRYAPNSRTIAHPLDLGYGVGGVELLLNLMRTNVLLVGGPGSGKSSALWSIIDRLSVCRDVVLHAIDLSGGPMARIWGDVFATRAFNRDEAMALLQREIARAHRRTVMLADRSEPREDGTAPQSENWTPDDGKFHIILVDELPLLAADDELRELYAEHQRIGRKAGCTSVAATQDLSGDTLKSTSLRKYPSTTVLFACSREDVTGALGGNKVQEGWAPHRFTPAEGEAENDAGKCYIKSGRHNRPIPWRFARLDDPAEIWSRAIERIKAGRPADDDEPVEIEDAAVVPPMLGAVAAVFRGAGEPEFMPTDELLTLLAEVTGQVLDSRKLAAGVKPQGLGSHRQRHDGKPTWGYRWADVEAALEAL